MNILHIHRVLHLFHLTIYLRDFLISAHIELPHIFQVSTCPNGIPPRCPSCCLSLRVGHMLLLKVSVSILGPLSILDESWDLDYSHKIVCAHSSLHDTFLGAGMFSMAQNVLPQLYQWGWRLTRIGSSNLTHLASQFLAQWYFFVLFFWYSRNDVKQSKCDKARLWQLRKDTKI